MGDGFSRDWVDDGRTEVFDVDIKVVAYFCRARRDESPWEPWLLLFVVVDGVGDMVDCFLLDDAGQK